MPSSEASLFWIAVIAVLAPLLAGFVPRRLVPEVVLLLVLHGLRVGHLDSTAWRDPAWRDYP